MEAVVLCDIWAGEGIKPNGKLLWRFNTIIVTKTQSSLIARPRRKLSGHAILASIIVLPTVARSEERSTVSRAVVLTTDTVTLATRGTCSHVTNCRTNSHFCHKSLHSSPYCWICALFVHCYCDHLILLLLQYIIYSMADVVYEEEAYLYSSPSDVQIYLSTNEVDLANTDSEGIVQPPVVKPYQYIRT